MTRQNEDLFTPILLDGGSGGLQPGAATLLGGCTEPIGDLALPDAGGLGFDFREVESAVSSCLVFLVLNPSRAVTPKPAVTGLLRSHCGL